MHLHEEAGESPAHSHADAATGVLTLTCVQVVHMPVSVQRSTARLNVKGAG